VVPTDQDRDAEARRNYRPILVGVISLAISACLLLLPLVLGANSLNRFLVAFGFLGACLGVSCMLNGAWDLWKARRR